MGNVVTSFPVWVSSTEICPLRQATNNRWSASSKPMATFVLHLVTGQLAMSSRLSRSTTSTWFLALLWIYIFWLTFSSDIASSVSQSILMSGSFLTALVLT